MKALRHVAAASLLVPLFVHATPLNIDAARSNVSAVFRQMNVPVEARFKQFNAVIDYDAQRPDAAKAQVNIATASMLANEVSIKFRVAAAN